VGQPEESFDVELAGPLPRQAQGPTDGGEGLRGTTVQAVASDDDVVQGTRQTGHQAVKSLTDKDSLSCFLKIGSLLGWMGDEKLLRMRLGLGHGPPNGSLDGWDSVGGEGSATCGVVAPQSLPQGDATYVQGLGIGEISQPLAAHHPVHQPFVLGQGMGNLLPMPNGRKCGILSHSDSSSLVI